MASERLTSFIIGVSVIMDFIGASYWNDNLV